MLPRFCLYGFLKNQRYFEPFLFLALLDKGLSFLAIGMLVAIREASVHLLEIPSGAAADLFGRRRSLLLSFLAYLLSFLAFGYASSFAALAGAMVLFGIGEAFRSGTHKAMIFAWLSQQGRADDKTRVYGLTRSFSKLGSALSALIAAALVFFSADYNSVFFWSAVPCALSIANLLSYPSSIDPRPAQPVTMAGVWNHLKATLGNALHRPRLRRMLIESMGFHGIFSSLKDYLQPVLLAAAVVWLGAEAQDLEDAQRAALLSGPVYFLLFLAAALASLQAHRFRNWAGGEDAATRRLWTLLAAILAIMALADYRGLAAVTVLAFVGLHTLQNLWRPILTSRIYAEVKAAQGATTLSVESQTQRVAAIILAPTFGWLVDSSGSFWPVPLLALAIAVGFRLRRPAG